MASDVLDSPAIAVHTEAVLKLKLRLSKVRAEEVAIAVEIGRHLIAVRTDLARGDWGRWLSGRVEIRQTQANAFIKLAEVCDDMPKKWLDAIALLGQTKVMRACVASDAFRPKLSATWTWKGVKAADMSADEFDHAVDAADPGHRTRKDAAGTGKGGRSGGGKAVDVDLDPPTLAEITAELKELRKREPDPRKWKPLLDWILREFGLAEAGAAKPAPASPATSTSTSSRPATSTTGAVPGLALPGYTLGASGAPAALLNPDGKNKLTSILAILRQLTADVKAMAKAKTRVGNDLKADAIDAGMDFVDAGRELAGWVSGTPRK